MLKSCLSISRKQHINKKCPQIPKFVRIQQDDCHSLQNNTKQKSYFKKNPFKNCYRSGKVINLKLIVLNTDIKKVPTSIFR